MPSKRDSKGFAILTPLVLALLLAATGCLGSDEGDGKKDGGDGSSEGDIVYAVNFTYLDDTEAEDGVWEVLVSGMEDHGVLLVRNEASESDKVDLAVVNVTEGWGIKLDSASVNVPADDVVPVTVSYTSGDEGGQAVLTATSEGDPSARDTLTLRFVKGDRAAQVTSLGDQLVVDYVLRDEGGAQLDAGTLPAQAGQPEAGPAGSLSYIEGFYLGLLGMEKGMGLGPSGIVHTDGETKTVKVPPELAYGTDPDQHELGGVWLYFTLTIVGSE